MKKLISTALIFCLSFGLLTTVFAKSDTYNGAEYDNSLETNSDALDLDVNAAYLLEAKTGTVLYSQNQFSKASPASVTKIMTLLLVAEALAAGSYKLDDVVSVSEYAASMGGSQVFLEEGERISVEDLIKCTVIASANDAAVALAELTAGSEAAFVVRMNKRAHELGLKNSSFENTTGLDDTTVDHYSCAADIAAMSRELIKHDIILKYSSVWQDTIRNGEFTLTNTNRLVRYYDGCNGLKTGSTDKAGYCVSTTAKRGNLQLIAVVMGAKTRDGRNAAARSLLDYGFSNYTLYEHSEQFIEDIPILSGVSASAPAYSRGFTALVEKSKASAIELAYEIPESLVAPINKEQVIGKITFKLDGNKIGECDIYSNEEIEKINVFELFLRILTRIICADNS